MMRENNSRSSKSLGQWVAALGHCRGMASRGGLVGQGQGARTAIRGDDYDKTRRHWNVSAAKPVLLPFSTIQISAPSTKSVSTTADASSRWSFWMTGHLASGRQSGNSPDVKAHLIVRTAAFHASDRTLRFVQST